GKPPHTEGLRQRRLLVEIETAHLSRSPILALEQVAKSGFGAAASPIRSKLQNMSVSAHPPALAAGHTHDPRVVRHVARHHRSGRNKTIPAQCDSADNGGIRSNRRAATDSRFLVERVAPDL